MAGRPGPGWWTERHRWIKAAGPLLVLVAAWLVLELLMERSRSPDARVIVLGLVAYLAWAIWAAERRLDNRIIASGVVVSSLVAVALFFAGLSLGATLATWLAFVLGVPWSRSWINWF